MDVVAGARHEARDAGRAEDVGAATEQPVAEARVAVGLQHVVEVQLELIPMTLADHHPGGQAVASEQERDGARGRHREAWVESGGCRRDGRR